MGLQALPFRGAVSIQPGFCLGILQALSLAGWLKKLDYMSTVSGGGYIGGSLSWLPHRKWKGEHGEEIPYGLDRRNFPYGTHPMVGMEDKHEVGNTSNCPAPATFLIVPISRPWMPPIFKARKVPKSLRSAIAAHMLNELAKALLELEGELPAFHVADTRKLLQRADADAKGNSGDWLNEIHPNSEGYRKIAGRLAVKLHKTL